MLAVGVAVIAVARGRALSAASRERHLDYASQERLWQRDIAARPSNARARDQLRHGTLRVRPVTGGRVAAPRRGASSIRGTSLASSTSARCCAPRAASTLCVIELDRALALSPAMPTRWLRSATPTRPVATTRAPSRSWTRALAARPDDVFRLNRLGWLLAVSRDDRVRNGAARARAGERVVSLTSRRDVMSLNTLAAALAETGHSPKPRRR